MTLSQVQQAQADDAKKVAAGKGQARKHDDKWDTLRKRDDKGREEKGKGKGKSSGGKLARLASPPADSSRQTSPSSGTQLDELRSDRHAPPWPAESIEPSARPVVDDLLAKHRKELASTLRELEQSHDIGDAALRIQESVEALCAAPESAEQRVVEVMEELVAKTVQVNCSMKRTMHWELLTLLCTLEWQTVGFCEATLRRFLTRFLEEPDAVTESTPYEDLKVDVPALPSIFRNEFIRMLRKESLLSEEEADAWLYKVK